MKFGQLIEHNIRNTLFEISQSKFRGEWVPNLFLKKQIEHISGVRV